ncbi:hypothetical protein BC628DRAFT_27196 [Trametes gibbosa]|nr:hypothetical protein BC628DRAFT_27196 [Trametes gibbosa]
MPFFFFFAGTSRLPTPGDGGVGRGFASGRVPRPSSRISLLRAASVGRHVHAAVCRRRVVGASGDPARARTRQCDAAPGVRRLQERRREGVGGVARGRDGVRDALGGAGHRTRARDHGDGRVDEDEAQQVNDPIRHEIGARLQLRVILTECHTGGHKPSSLECVRTRTGSASAVPRPRRSAFASPCNSAPAIICLFVCSFVRSSSLPLRETDRRTTISIELGLVAGKMCHRLRCTPSASASSMPAR